MKYLKYLFLFLIFVLLSAGCTKITLKQEIPSSPKESYGQLPK